MDGHGQRTTVCERRAAALTTPQGALRHGQRRPPAARADPLVVAVATRDVVLEPELTFYLDQILDVHARAEGMAATAAVRQLLAPADVLVEADTKLRRPLFDVMNKDVPVVEEVKRVPIK